MKDLKNPRLIWLKAILLLLIGVVSGVLVFLEAPTLRVAVMLGVAIWAFCRAYYFAFYVIEHYLEPGFHYSGLLSVVRHLLGSGGKRR